MCLIVRCYAMVVIEFDSCHDWISVDKRKYSYLNLSSVFSLVALLLFTRRCLQNCNYHECFFVCNDQILL
jgi:hypothetical protein